MLESLQILSKQVRALLFWLVAGLVVAGVITLAGKAEATGGNNDWVADEVANSECVVVRYAQYGSVKTRNRICEVETRRLICWWVVEELVELGEKFGNIQNLNEINVQCAPKFKKAQQ